MSKIIGFIKLLIAPLIIHINYVRQTAQTYKKEITKATHAITVRASYKKKTYQLSTALCMVIDEIAIARYSGRNAEHDGRGSERRDARREGRRRVRRSPGRDCFGRSVMAAVRDLAIESA